MDLKCRFLSHGRSECGITHPGHQRSLWRICHRRIIHTVLLTVTPAASCFHIRAAHLLAFYRSPQSQRSRPGKVCPRLPNESPTPSLPPTPPRRPPNSRHLRGPWWASGAGPPKASRRSCAALFLVIPHMTRAPPTVAVHGAKRSPSVRHLSAEVASPLYGS